MSVWLVAILYATQVVIQLGANRTRLAEVVCLAHLDVVNLLDWSDYSRCSACSSLLERFKFLNWNLTALHLHSHILGQLHKTAVGYGWKD